jgi:hypothetical protein
MAPNGWFCYEREIILTWTDDLDFLSTIGFFSWFYINSLDSISHFWLALQKTLAKYMVEVYGNGTPNARGIYNN